jgi:hypothetical protein
MTDQSDNLSLDALKRDFDEFRSEVRDGMAAQTRATKELVEAWNAAGKVLVFVKGLAKLMAAIGVIYVAFRHGLGIKAD